MKHTESLLWNPALFENFDRIEGACKHRVPCLRHARDGFGIGMVLMGVCREEDVYVQVFRLDEDRKLTIQTVIQIVG